MTNFIGDHPCKVDGKGRILFPAALKKQISGDGTRFVVKKDLFEKCLIIYTQEEWERQVNHIKAKTNSFNKEHNAFVRGFYRGTAEVVLDASSRILVPRRLLEIVGIDKEVVMAGQDSKIELWAKEAYDGIEQNDLDFAALAEKIMQGTNNEED
ncbi:MAG: division/cell wall cluster transcriptional repressor MraZ [Salinivirgaceae bacterium]|nr:division/cell wall cluster transcriptional repressor MraZ [Salinivirgaceae bacterium]